MEPLLVLVWLASGGDAEVNKPHLDAWARQHAVSLVQPADSGSVFNAPLEPVLRIEALFDEARTSASVAPGRTHLALRRAEQWLWAHPEYPQAAWLMAERYRLEAQVRRVAGADEQVERISWLERAADALEGTRAPAFGPEDPKPPHGVASADTAASRDAITVRIQGSRATDSIFVDGRLRDHDVELALGYHHFYVTRADRAIWAGWLTLDAENRVIRLPLHVAPCSRTDLADVRPTASRPMAHEDVQCPRWVAARPREGGIEIAECKGSVCNDWQRWPASTAQRSSPPAPPQSDTQGLLPWALAVGGASALAFVGLWQLGAFDRDTNDRTEFTFTGPNAAGAGSPVTFSF